MQAISYPVKHTYQTTNNNCSQTALSMLLSYYGQDLTPESIMAEIPVNYDNNGEPWGTINQQLATWCITKGYQVGMYTFDCQVVDMGWQDIDSDALLGRLEAAKAGRTVPALGADWSKMYLQSYADFVRAGGELYIKPHVSTALLNELIMYGPLLACVCYNTLYGVGRSKSNGLRQHYDDDIHGQVYNHSIVVYGVHEDGSYEIADPMREPGRHIIDPERLLCAITAAQIECDNLLFQIKK